MSDEYALLHVAARQSRNWVELGNQINSACAPQWTNSGAQIWGQFAGLFGLASNELYLILHNPAQAALETLTAPLANAQVKRAVRLRATARPAQFDPLRKPGLYVFRSFRLQPGAVQQTVQLSRQAWTTFENGEYQAQAQGLFQELDQNSDEDQNMLLLTWYDGFASWEQSRSPAPEATQNFSQRQALTTRTGAIATRLVGR